MKHLKKHPVTEPKNQLSKDMKKQDHVKSKKDKALDADKSLSKKPRIPRKQNKVSNRKLDGEKFLSKQEKQSKRSRKPSNKELDGEKFLSENRGKGKSWGKKSKKKSVNENVDKATINRFLGDFGMLTTFNLVKVQDLAKTDEAKNKLAEMQRTLNTFTSNYFDVIDPTKNEKLYEPETLSKIIGTVGEHINYIKPHIEKLVKDCDTKDVWFKKIEDLSTTYLKIIGKTNENRVYLIKNMLNENSEVLDVVEVFSIYNSEDSHTLEPEVKPIEKPTI